MRPILTPARFALSRPSLVREYGKLVFGEDEPFPSQRISDIEMVACHGAKRLAKLKAHLAGSRNNSVTAEEASSLVGKTLTIQVKILGVSRRELAGSNLACRG